MPGNRPADLLTVSQLAERLNVKPSTVLRWYRTARIPARKLSPKVLRFDLSEVLDALDPARSKGGAL